MTVDNLPALRTSTALAAIARPAEQPARTGPLTTAELPLPGVLLGAAIAWALIAAVSAYAHRYEQTALVGVAALALFIASGITYYQERQR